jgi:hypothetical protein
MKLPNLLPRRSPNTLLDVLTGAEIVAGGLTALMILRWLL